MRRGNRSIDLGIQRSYCVRIQTFTCTRPSGAHRKSNGAHAYVPKEMKRLDGLAWWIEKGDFCPLFYVVAQQAVLKYLSLTPPSSGKSTLSLGYEGIRIVHEELRQGFCTNVNLRGIFAHCTLDRQLFFCLPFQEVRFVLVHLKCLENYCQIISPISTKIDHRLV